MAENHFDPDLRESFAPTFTFLWAPVSSTDF